MECFCKFRTFVRNCSTRDCSTVIWQQEIAFSGLAEGPLIKCSRVFTFHLNFRLFGTKREGEQTFFSYHPYSIHIYTHICFAKFNKTQHGNSWMAGLLAILNRTRDVLYSSYTTRVTALVRGHKCPYIPTCTGAF